MKAFLHRLRSRSKKDEDAHKEEIQQSAPLSNLPESAESSTTTSSKFSAVTTTTATTVDVNNPGTTGYVLVQRTIQSDTPHLQPNSNHIANPTSQREFTDVYSDPDPGSRGRARQKVWSEIVFSEEE